MNPRLRQSALVLCIALGGAYVAWGKSTAQQSQRGVLAAGSAAFVPTPCVGDCNGDGLDTVDELVKGINIALGNAPLTDCPIFNCNGDGHVTVNCIVKAVNIALNGCGPSPTVTPTVGPDSGAVERGLQFLSVGNLQAASGAFNEAVTAAPNDDRANLYFALARIAVKVLDDPQLVALRQRAGAVMQGDSSHVCALRMTLPDPLPPGTPHTGEILDTVRAVLLPELAAARANVSRLSANPKILFDITNLPGCARPITDVQVVEIDQGDRLVLDAGLSTASAFIEMVSAYNVDLDVQTARLGTVQSVLQLYPQLGKLLPAAPDRLLSARQSFSDGSGALIQAIDEILAETGDQTDQLVTIDQEDVEDAKRVRKILSLAQQSLTGVVTLPIDVVTGQIVLMDIGILPQERLNLSRLFSGSLANLRTLLPPFGIDGNFEHHALPDPTLGGIFPDMTQDKWDHFLVGGPECVACNENRDCNAFGLGDFYCGYCYGDCTGVMSRCTQGYALCADGTFY